MKKKKQLYVVGDIHGFYDEFIQALNQTDYDEKNPDHLLISLGDNFDRGPKPQEVLNFWSTHKNSILVKGNHEDLIMACLERGYPVWADHHNGTVGTIEKLGNFSTMTGSFDAKWRASNNLTYEKIKDFVFSMLNYYETEKYIFVHSWIPLKEEWEEDNQYPGWYLHYKEDWRESHQPQWDEARWGNPFELAEQKLNKTGKTIVFGHWHTSWWREQHENKKAFSPETDFSPVFLRKYGCIGIDACTAYSGKVNVLCLKDCLLEESNEQENS